MHDSLDLRSPADLFHHALRDLGVRERTCARLSGLGEDVIVPVTSHCDMSHTCIVYT